MVAPLRVLFVDDSELDVVLSANALRDAGLSLSFERVETPDGFRSALARGGWDVVICDHSMPEFDSLSALRLLNESGHDLPFLIVSGIIPDDVAIEAMREGARDFVNKNNLSRLAPAVAREVQEARNRDLLRQSQRAIDRMMRFDMLTGLPNGEALGERLEALTAGGEPFALFLVDLNRFRKIVQGLGSVIGNRVLHGMGKRLTVCCGEDDFIARLGSDRFALVFPGPILPGRVADLCARVREVLAAPLVIDEEQIHLSCSIGGAGYPEHAATAADLLHCADVALGHAKDAGPNQHCWFSSGMTDDHRGLIMLESALHQAVARGEFELHYQPQVDMASGRVIGVEALLRWRRNGQGLVSPAEFIPMLEQSGLIVGVGEWVLQEACRQLRAWRAAGQADLRMAVNLSAVQFMQGDLAAMVSRVLDASGVPPAQVELELTENIAMHNEECVLNTLRALKALGVSLAIDDFGTGYSSLSYLQHFPVDRLKIDRAFIRDARPDDDLAIVRAVVAMGRSLKLDVIAEGVEESFQADILQRCGCAEAQGFLFGRPMAAAACSEYLAATEVAQ